MLRCVRRMIVERSCFSLKLERSSLNLDIEGIKKERGTLRILTFVVLHGSKRIKNIIELNRTNSPGLSFLFIIIWIVFSNVFQTFFYYLRFLKTVIFSSLKNIASFTSL